MEEKMDCEEGSNREAEHAMMTMPDNVEALTPDEDQICRPHMITKL